MRTASIASAYYSPGQIPTDAEDLQRFLREELNKLSSVIALLASGHLDKSTVAPIKPRDGDIRYADGINWKPNAIGGAGVWYYNGTLWLLLG